MKYYAAILCLMVVLNHGFAQISECRIDFNTTGDGTAPYGCTWNVKGHSNASPLSLKNIDNSTAGATLRISGYDDLLSPGCWSYGSVGWIYWAEEKGADCLLYSSDPTTSFIYLENLELAYYRIDLVASYPVEYCSNYRIGEDFGVVRDSDGDIVGGMTGENYNPLNGYNNGYYLSWSDIVPDDGNITLQVYGSNHNLINVMRIVYTGDYSLPVSLSSFTAQWRNGRVEIDWTIESECNTLGYKILRSDSQNGPYRCIASFQTNPALAVAGDYTGRRDYQYTDDTALSGCKYWYKLNDVDHDGVITEHPPVFCAAVANPCEFRLFRNYPNPFNPVTTFSFEIPGRENSRWTSLIIYNILGEQVCCLFRGELESGYYEYKWDGIDDFGRVLPGGIYIARLRSGNDVRTIKMSFLR